MARRPPGALDLIDEILEELETPKRQIQLTADYNKSSPAFYGSSTHMSSGNSIRLSIMPPHGVLASQTRRRKPRARSIGFCIVG